MLKAATDLGEIYTDEGDKFKWKKGDTNSNEIDPKREKAVLKILQAIGTLFNILLISPSQTNNNICANTKKFIVSLSVSHLSLATQKCVVALQKQVQEI